MAKPWPERPVSAANKSGKQWRCDEKVLQSERPLGQPEGHLGTVTVLR